MLLLTNMRYTQNMNEKHRSGHRALSGSRTWRGRTNLAPSMCWLWHPHKVDTVKIDADANGLLPGADAPEQFRCVALGEADLNLGEEWKEMLVIHRQVLEVQHAKL